MTKTHIFLFVGAVAAGYLLRDTLLRAPIYPKVYSWGANLSTPAIPAAEQNTAVG